MNSNEKWLIAALVFALLVLPCAAAECDALIVNNNVSLNGASFEDIMRGDNLTPVSKDFVAGQLNISARNNDFAKATVAGDELRMRGFVATFESGHFEQVVTSKGTFYNVTVNNTDPWLYKINVVRVAIDDADTKDIDHIYFYYGYDENMENLLVFAWGYDETVKITTDFSKQKLDGGDSAGGGCSSGSGGPGGGGPGGGGPSGSTAGSSGVGSSISTADAGSGWPG